MEGFPRCYLGPMATDAETASALLLAYSSMGDTERELWVEQGARILMGQKRYGKVRRGKKNWKKELYEELLDTVFYTMMELIELRDGRTDKAGKKVVNRRTKQVRSRVRKVGPKSRVHRS